MIMETKEVMQEVKEITSKELKQMESIIKEAERIEEERGIKVGSEGSEEYRRGKKKGYEEVSEKIGELEGKEQFVVKLVYFLECGIEFTQKQSEDPVAPNFETGKVDAFNKILQTIIRWATSTLLQKQN